MRLFLIWISSFITCLLLVAYLVAPQSRFTCTYAVTWYGGSGYYGGWIPPVCDKYVIRWHRENLYRDYAPYKSYTMYCCVGES